MVRGEIRLAAAKPLSAARVNVASVDCYGDARDDPVRMLAYLGNVKGLLSRHRRQSRTDLDGRAFRRAHIPRDELDHSDTFSVELFGRLGGEPLAQLRHPVGNELRVADHDKAIFI